MSIRYLLKLSVSILSCNTRENDFYLSNFRLLYNRQYRRPFLDKQNMLHHEFVLLLLQSSLVFSIFRGTTKKRGEYGTIHGEMQYFKPGEDGVLADMNEIHSMHQCAHQCMFNELCRTATYYDDSKSCRLFSVGCSQGSMTSRAKTKVIDFADRSKE